MMQEGPWTRYQSAQPAPAVMTLAAMGIGIVVGALLVPVMLPHGLPAARCCSARRLQRPWRRAWVRAGVPGPPRPSA
jgi:hypothetical protein